MNWVYILRCADNTLYTGWTTDLQKRLAAHNAGRGAKYTRGRGPVLFVYTKSYPTKADAMQSEAALKKLTRPQKEALILQQQSNINGGNAMEQHILVCKNCGARFFTEGEKSFYESNRLMFPKSCKDCRNKTREITLEEISTSWNIEAKQESGNYFYNTAEAKKLINGSRHFVIGRKGTGKTAIASYLYASCDNSESFSERLSFKNFPFKYFYSLENSKYTAPNQYITIWKYLIYSSVCKMMTRNPKIKASIRAGLEKLYPNDSETSLSRMVEKWTATSFGAEVFGVALNAERELQDPKELSWIEKTNILEDIIIDYLDTSSYYIVIDELDEDYREFGSLEEKKIYLHLLTSLFKALQDIRAIAKTAKLSVYPIVFLRTDIYSLIKDSDKNKWSAFRIDLDWSEASIKKMLAHRISVASGGGEALTFEQAWGVLFSPEDAIMVNNQKSRMNTFDYITRSTQLRPRDYIHYLVKCAREAKENGEDKISAQLVRRVDDKFSEYLRNEIEDEAHSVLPEISEILDILSQNRKQTFPPKDFITAYDDCIKEGRIQSNQGAENVLRMLFEFSVIGNQPSIHSKAIFKYQTVSARFNYKENAMIHRGLYKALQIY